MAKLSQNKEKDCCMMQYIYKILVLSFDRKAISRKILLLWNSLFYYCTGKVLNMF